MKTKMTLFVSVVAAYAVGQLLLLSVMSMTTVISPPQPPVLMISFDGFRWDYLDVVKRSGRETPNFDQLIENGSKAKWVKNSYITLTFPNHYTIATGLYEENHGVIGNIMYDPDFNEVFNIRNSEQKLESKWWNNGSESWKGEPIWLTNQQVDGQRSGVYYWIGSEASIRGQQPYHFTHYNWSMPYNKRVNTVIDWLTTADDPVNLAMLYFEEPDNTGHKFGPNSQQILDKIVEMDTLLGYIVQSLDEKDLFAGLNLIVTSDHGMAEMTDIIYLEDYVDSSLYTLFGETPVMHVLPKQGELETVYQKLQAIPYLIVYRKELIPAEYHYQHNRRVMPIVIESTEGYYICQQRNNCHMLKGDHGYDNSHPNMHPIFIAHGPSFKSKFVADPFNNVDIYPLLCHLLGVKPAIHDGSLDNIKHILKDPSHGHGLEGNAVRIGRITAFSIVAGILVLFAALMIILKWTSAGKFRRNNYHRDITGIESASLLDDDMSAEPVA